MKLNISNQEKQRILEMHYREVNKHFLGEQQAAPAKGAKPQADFNEGVVISLNADCENEFHPTCMTGKTINLYEDNGKAVWDQSWYIVGTTDGNYGKLVTFNLNKDMGKNGSPRSPETGTMTYDCMKPDQFTVTYKGTNPEISNQPRFNPEVQNKLKTQYCPSVLNVKAAGADFAANQPQGGQPTA